jgi:hypothetical protein
MQTPKGHVSSCLKTVYVLGTSCIILNGDIGL